MDHLEEGLTECTKIGEPIGGGLDEPLGEYDMDTGEYGLKVVDQLQPSCWEEAIDCAILEIEWIECGTYGMCILVDYWNNVLLETQLLPLQITFCLEVDMEEQVHETLLDVPIGLEVVDDDMQTLQRDVVLDLGLGIVIFIKTDCAHK